LEETHPDIYSNGPTPEMYKKFDDEFEQYRKPWSGVWPGVEECREYGLYCYWDESAKHKWVECGPDHPGATENLNRLNEWGDFYWDIPSQRWVKRKEA
jgi:hypothetical protein